MVSIPENKTTAQNESASSPFVQRQKATCSRRAGPFTPYSVQTASKLSTRSFYSVLQLLSCLTVRSSIVSYFAYSLRKNAVPWHLGLLVILETLCAQIAAPAALLHSVSNQITSNTNCAGREHEEPYHSH